MTDRPLTERQTRFVESYALTGNAAEAARIAGYSTKTAGRIGLELLAKSHVAAAIAANAATRTAAAVADADERRAFWSQVMRDADVEMKDRLRASQLLAAVSGDFVVKRLEQSITVRRSYGFDWQALLRQPPEVGIDDPIANAIDGQIADVKHLSESQRSLVAAKIANLPHGGDRSKSPIGDLGTTQAEAAQLLNVGKRSVERAREVLDHGAAEPAAPVVAQPTPQRDELSTIQATMQARTSDMERMLRDLGV